MRLVKEYITIAEAARDIQNYVADGKMPQRLALAIMVYLAKDKQFRYFTITHTIDVKVKE